MITITQRDGKWRIAIAFEEWQFPTKREFDDALKKINEFKGKYGDVYQIDKKKLEEVVKGGRH